MNAMDFDAIRLATTPTTDVNVPHFMTHLHYGVDWTAFPHEPDRLCLPMTLCFLDMINYVLTGWPVEISNEEIL
jgi:hypothetical protein